MFSDQKYISLSIIKNIPVLSRTDIFPAFGSIFSTRLVSSVLPNYAAMIHLQNIGAFSVSTKVLKFQF